MKTTVLIIAMAFHGSLAFSQVPQLVWGRQLGTTAADFADRVAADADGNSWFAGYTSGTLGSQAFGGYDVVVGKFDPAGNRLWVTQLGTAQDEAANAITLDPQGNAYITGHTAGKLGDAQFGGIDAFICKLNTNGTVSWIRQFGASGTNAGNAIKLDASGNIFVAGATTGRLGTNHFGGQDCFLSKFDPNGQMLWTRQWGTFLDDGANGMAFDSGGNIYVVGQTYGRLGGAPLGGGDMFLTEIDPAGNILWSQQYGTSSPDSAMCVVVDDETNIYIGGSTLGNMGAPQLGNGDSVLMKLSSTGTLIWQRQFGSAGWDGIKAVLLSPGDPKGVIVSGCANWPQCFAFVRKFDPQGNTLWENDIHPAQATCGGTIAMDNHGNLFQCGGTTASLYSTYQGGGNDIFLVKYLMLDLFPVLAVSLNDTNVNLSWSTNYPAFTLESVAQLGGTWTPVPGVTGYSATLPISAGTNQIFRLRE
jgi:Beta-propeller repeat